MSDTEGIITEEIISLFSPLSEPIKFTVRCLICGSDVATYLAIDVCQECKDAIKEMKEFIKFRKGE